MASFTVVYDACVFYPAPLRDLLIRLAQTRTFRARWTKKIQEEWLEALLRNQPKLNRDKLNRTVKLLNDAVPDCLISDYEQFIDTLRLPDPDDRHVLAAAIRVGAAAIVTLNLKHFPNDILRKFDIFAIHPDDFVLDLADLSPEIIVIAAKQQRSALQAPPYSAEEFVDIIRSQGLPGVAEFLEKSVVALFKTLTTGNLIPKHPTERMGKTVA